MHIIIHLLFPWTFSIINNIKSAHQHYRSQAAVPAPAAGQLLCSAAERQRRGPRLAMSLADHDDHTCSIAAYPLCNVVGHPRRLAKLETTSIEARSARASSGNRAPQGPGRRRWTAAAAAAAGRGSTALFRFLALHLAFHHVAAQSVTKGAFDSILNFRILFPNFRRDFRRWPAAGGRAGCWWRAGCLVLGGGSAASLAAHR